MEGYYLRRHHEATIQGDITSPIHLALHPALPHSRLAPELYVVFVLGIVRAYESRGGVRWVARINALHIGQQD